MLSSTVLQHVSIYIRPAHSLQSISIYTYTSEYIYISDIIELK